VSAGPDISVVVASVGRDTRLAFLLEALGEQTLPRERYEVIVVRGRSAGDPAGPAGPAGELGATVIDAEPAGPGELRNTGVRAARAPLVAFTDDDCRPAADWLERLLEEAARADGDVILQGRTEPDPDELRRLHGLARSQVIVGPSDWYQACNIAYPRELFERLGGFDERFDGGGEDADLGLRAVAAGARAVYVDSARVWHAVHSRHLWDALRDQGRWHTIPLVIARHADQRQALELGVFWRRGHPRVLLAVAGLAASRRHPLLAAAATVPYVRHHLRGYGSGPRALSRAALDLPARALVDLAGVAATLRAARRHRALVA
jgi:GT2 family glycosyltransferase